MLTPVNGEKLIFPVADGTVKISGGDQGSENIHLDPGQHQTEEKNKIIFEENQTGLLQLHVKTHRGMMVDPVNLYVPTSGEFICPFHIEPRVTCERENQDLFRLTIFDVISEKHIEDHWNVDGDRELSDARTGFTRFIVMNEKPPDGLSWSGERH